MTVSSIKSTAAVSALTLTALGLLIAIFYAPIWWVSLTAPNYPPEAFPDGVRIHFHMNGVFNGCARVEKSEIAEEEALDCVHEMDTINHYVGMYPIASGGAIERALSPFLMSMLAVMIIGFAVSNAKWRVWLMGLGFAGVSAWMLATLFTADGLRYQSQGYLSALVTALDQDAKAEGAGKTQSAGSSLVARLRAELEKSGIEIKGATPEPAKVLSAKDSYIEQLRVNFQKDQEHPGADHQAWTGGGAQMLLWHYGKSLGRYFNDPAQIRPMVRTLKLVFYVVVAGILGAMVLLLWGARRNGGLLYWLTVLVPLLLPVFFVIEYSGWLWWYGHHLNEMGAFTVKPFMPTVFGQGKVAQFATHSYPYTGFFLMLALSVVLAALALIRRRQWR